MAVVAQKHTWQADRWAASTDSWASPFDGSPLVGIPRSVTTHSLAMVQQDIQLYGCSVRDNLTLWNPSITTTDLRRACRDAEIDDVVQALPEGWNPS